MPKKITPAPKPVVPKKGAPPKKAPAPAAAPKKAPKK